jgi:hypothetical protein
MLTEDMVGGKTGPREETVFGEGTYTCQGSKNYNAVF